MNAVLIAASVGAAHSSGPRCPCIWPDGSRTVASATLALRGGPGWPFHQVVSEPAVEGARVLLSKWPEGTLLALSAGSRT